MATYFGETTPGASTAQELTTSFWCRNKNKIYTCPGTGNQNLVELQAYVRQYISTTTNIRLALYDTSNNLIYQGSAEVLVSNASFAWMGHTGITGVVLTGGTNYRIALSYDGFLEIAYNLETAGNHTGSTVDYTGGWPSSLSDGSDDDYIKSIRAGVDPGTGGGKLVILSRK